jgi:DHA2 family methylenomycin A resistance protein-like MFS transporter
MCAGYFLVLLDVTIVNVALPQSGSGLGAQVSGLQWVVDGYAIALAAVLLTSGTVGDLHGHKRVVLCGLAVFGAASLGCGLAPSTGVLVGARVVQGIGAALLLPGTLAIISEAYPGRGGSCARAARRSPETWTARACCSAGCCSRPSPSPSSKPGTPGETGWS